MFQKVLHILLVCTDTEKPKKEPLRFKVSLSDAAVVLWGVRTAPVFFSSSSCTVTVICIYNLSTHMCFSDFCVVKGIMMMMMMMIIACAKTKYTLEDLFCVNEPCLHLTNKLWIHLQNLVCFPALSACNRSNCSRKWTLSVLRCLSQINIIFLLLIYFSFKLLLLASFGFPAFFCGTLLQLLHCRPCVFSRASPLPAGLVVWRGWFLNLGHCVAKNPFNVGTLELFLLCRFQKLLCSAH